ncbi:hypothetical protein [Wolbachia endosymbiont (group A) of Chalcis sispes]|uniref:hypothetical protein n=1 Tax=Wolbachia endosymbiont (group A) of Chalcis sispes TaxID=3066197 RepID=UPI0031332A42
MGIKELVNAFNLNNYACDKIDTNFTVEGKKIVGLFASGTNTKEYLRRMEKEIIGRHYGTREIANEYYNLDCFPFVLGANHDEEYLGNGIVKVKLADSTDPAVIHNLKVHFASEFKRAVRSKVAACLQKEVGISEEEAYEWVNETVGTGAIGKPYLYCIAFSNEYLKREYDLETFEFFKQAYIKEFNSRLENCGLKSSNFYEYKDDVLYIKDVSDKVVRSVAEYVKGRVALYLGTPGTEDSKVENFKDVLGDFIFKLTGKSINAYEYDIFTDKKKIENGNDFVLIPLTKRYSGQLESLKHKDAYKINTIHKDFVSDIRGKTAKPDVASYESPVYAISNKRIAQLLPEIMQSPIAYNQIHGRFEFAVDLENFKRRGSSRSSSTVTSPFNSPTHAGQSGLRTPPNQRKADTDSGYDSNSPPKPKDSGSSSGGPGPSTELSDMEWESPTRSQDGALEDSPRRGSEQGSETEKEGRLLHNHVNLAGTSKGFPPLPQLNSIAVSYGVSGPSSLSQSVSTAQNRWSSQGTSGNKWMPSRQFTEPGPSGLSWSQSGPSSWKGANPVGANPWAQQTNPCLSQGTSENKWISSMQFTKPGPSGLSCSQSGASSSRGAGKNMPTGSSSWCLPPSTSSLTTRNDPISSNLGIFADPPEDTENICSMKEKQQVTKEKEEEKLSKALLYTFNLMNYTLDGVYTNFFAKDGKIVSLLHDNVDREEYLQAVIDYVVEEYYETEKEARESCDFDEFPFKFLPDPDYEKNQNDCEKNSRKTVVANISSGALSNLEKLFRQKFGKNVGAIDTNWVKKVEKREKDEWVDRQRSYGASLQDACESCFPDEGPMKIIPIALEGDEYVLDRSREECEVKLLLREQKLRLRGTLVNEEEKGLFKALLYAFNYSNNNFDLPDTNFIVKNGKIASLIPDSVNVEEYLQEVIDKTKEEYCEDKKEAYDLDEFPFELNCEKNQETTVVANISRGALFNLKKLFIYGYKKKAETGDIDINTVEEAVKSKKDELVNSKVKGIEREGGYYSRIKPDEAATASYPDGNALEGIPIIKGKGGYCLDRTFNDWETKLFVEDSEYTKGTSKAKKMKSEDNKDSGISSGEATDAENVSSKAEGKTSGTSGYESMDCENTRGGSPKHTLELSVENLRISTKLDATKAEQHSPIKKFRSN